MPLTVVADADAVAAAAAERLTQLIELAIAVRGSAVVSLTGGSTPRRLYQLLGDASHPWRHRIDWTRLHLFWGDERHVPPDHRDSNFGMARDALLQAVPIAAAQVHRMRAELSDARDAAREYEVTLREGFTAAGRDNLRFDVMLLGLGEDAHIASIFPESELLEEASGTGEERVAAVWAAHLGAWRITLTPLALLDADLVLMVVAGEQKAAAVHAALRAPLDLGRYPAQLLRNASDRVEWIVDTPSAARLGDASNPVFLASDL